MARKSYKSFKIAAFRIIGTACVDCGSRDLSKLEIDHRDWREKSFNPSDEYNKKPWSQLVLELQKCVPRCHSCHQIKTKQDRKEQAAERTVEERDFTHGTRYARKVMKCDCSECLAWGAEDARKRREKRKAQK